MIRSAARITLITLQGDAVLAHNHKDEAQHAKKEERPHFSRAGANEMVWRCRALVCCVHLKRKAHLRNHIECGKKRSAARVTAGPRRARSGASANLKPPPPPRLKNPDAHETMKLHSICVLRWNGDTAEPVLLDGACSLAGQSAFTRGAARAYLQLASKRLAPGAHAIDYEGARIYCLAHPDGLSVMVTADAGYPQRAAFALARELAADFRAAHPAAAWRGCAADGGCKLPTLEAALRKWQEPAAAGGVEEAQLGEAQGAAAQSASNALAQRGEKLEDLQEKSSNLADSAKHFTMAHRSSGFLARLCPRRA